MEDVKGEKTCWEGLPGKGRGGFKSGRVQLGGSGRGQGM